MGVKRDYYEALGVGRDADEHTIKKAYRKLAKKYHPDSSAGNSRAEELFKEVTEAYEVLSDPEKKKLYDRFGHAAFDGSMAGGAGGGFSGGGFSGSGFSGGGFSGSGFYDNGFSDGSSWKGRFYHDSDPEGNYQEYHFEGGDMDDILREFFGGRGSFGSRGSFGAGFDAGTDFGSRGGFGSGAGSRSWPGFGDGADLHADISISFDEAVSGCEKMLRLENGKTLQVRIPAGIDTGKSIRLRGKGQPGTGGGRAGDLLLRVTVGEKRGFERKGMDVYTTIQIPYTKAVFGGEETVRTLYGNVRCKIAEGTQSGTKIRLRGKGIVSMQDPKQYGDQYVTVQIQVPKSLNEAAKRKLREYEQAS